MNWPGRHITLEHYTEDKGADLKRTDLDKCIVQAQIENMRRQSLDSLVGQCFAFIIVIAVLFLPNKTASVPAS